MSSQSLPIEVWRTILRFATYVPFTLDTEWLYDRSDYIWTGWGTPSESPDTDPTMTKRAIVLVCRRWREMGIEFLYETIQIPLVTHRVSRLIEIFKRSTSESYVGHGWWTKRIGWTGQVVPTALEEVMPFLKLCYNLQIFAVGARRIPSSDQLSLAEILRSRFSHSLRRVDIVIAVPDMDHSTNYTDTLPDVPLTSLSISVRMPLSDIPFHTQFYTVSTLTIHIPGQISSLPTKWYLPNLRSLALYNFNEDDLMALEPFIGRHNRTLTHLHLQPTNRECDFLLLVSRAPNIRSLAFSYMHLQYLGELVPRNDGPTARLPGITHLGILQPKTITDAFPIASAVGSLLEFGVFPDLLLFRLLERINAEQTVVWMEVSTVLRHRGIRVEDVEGNELLLNVDLQ